MPRLGRERFQKGVAEIVEMSRTPHRSAQRGAYLPIMAFLLPVLLSFALFSYYLAQAAIVEGDLRTAAELSAASAVSFYCREPSYPIHVGGDYPDIETCGTPLAWNEGLVIAYESLRQHLSHGDLESSKQMLKVAPTALAPFLEPRYPAGPDAGIPEWSGSGMTVRIDRGWVDEEGKFQSLEGLQWDVTHPGVSRYQLYSAVRIKLTRNISIRLPFGLSPSQIAVEAVASMPHDRILVAPFALPLCSIADWYGLFTMFNPDFPIYLTPTREGLDFDLLFTGTSRHLSSVPESGCSAVGGSWTEDGCQVLPEFSWTPLREGDLRNSHNEVTNLLPGICNWNTGHKGNAVADPRGLLRNYGVIGLPIVPDLNPGEWRGFYADYDTTMRPYDFYRETSVTEATVKDILNNLHDNVPLVQAMRGWRFKVIKPGLTGDSPGEPIGNVIWKQIQNSVGGASSGNLCREGTPEEICNHTTLSSVYPEIGLQQLAWDPTKCQNNLFITQGLCRSMVVPDSTTTSSGACIGDVSDLERIKRSGVWQVLVPIIADMRPAAPTNGVEPLDDGPLCGKALYDDYPTIVGFAKVNLFDASFDTSAYTAPAQCTNPVFRNVGDLRLDLPLWGFTSPAGTPGCNLIRGRLDTNSRTQGTAAAYNRQVVRIESTVKP